MNDALDALRALGAHLHDPVRFRYLEGLAARMKAQPALVQQVLGYKFDQTVADYRLRAADPASGEGASPMAMRQAGSAHTRSPLAQLNNHIAARYAEDARDGDEADDAVGVRAPSDMKSVRRFAATWSRLSTEKQLSQALTRGPEHAGPLNSHNLMLRAMSLMHGLSPDYLRRFLAQADALLYVDRLHQQHALKDGKTSARRGRAKK